MIAIVVLLIAAAVGWIVFTQLRARRLGVSCPFSVPFSLSDPTGKRAIRILDIVLVLIGGN